MKSALDVIELVNMGKMAEVSHDEKKTIGEEPVTVDRFFQDNAVRFKKQQ